MRIGAWLAALALLALPAAALGAAPVFEHSPSAPAPEADIAVRARIVAAGGVLEPALFWRTAGAKAFKRVALRSVGADRFEAAIPRAEVGDAESVEYYLQAFDPDLVEGAWRSKDAPHRLRVRAAEPGRRTLSIGSEPPGAMLDLDGATVGTTPWKGKVAPGKHVFLLRLPGFARFEQDLRLPADRDVSLNIPLTRESAAAAPAPVAAPAPAAPPAPPARAAGTPLAPGAHAAAASQEPGLLKIRSTPPGARVRIDGVDAGTTPLSKEVAPGDHEVVLSAEGYKEASARVAVAALTEVTTSFELTALPGLLEVDTVPTGAFVRVDGQPVGTAPFTVKLAGGEHEIEATLEGFAPSRQRVKVSRTETAKVRVVLQRAGTTRVP